MGTGYSGLFSGTYGNGCFSAGTLVFTKTGYMPIEHICCGDYVYAKNVDTGEKGLKRVIGAFVHLKDSLVKMSLGDTVIVTTDAHPFWVRDYGWLCPPGLMEGDFLETFEGDTHRVALIEHQRPSSDIEVYNIEVEDWHTYYVSELGVLVHNKAMQNVFNSIKESPNYPRGFRMAKNGTKKNTATNKDRIFMLRSIEPGTWKKVYKDGYDANGKHISIHYYESETGRVYDVKIKHRWSNEASK
jgi:hypothetical protein